MARISATVGVLIVLALCVLCKDASALSCCRKYTKGVVSINFIKGYSIQTNERDCNINAVIFHTYWGRNICADPFKTWVMENIRKLKVRVQALKKNIQKTPNKHS